NVQEIPHTGATRRAKAVSAMANLRISRKAGLTPEASNYYSDITSIDTEGSMQPRAERRREHPAKSRNGYAMIAFALTAIAVGLCGIVILRGPGLMGVLAEALLLVLGIFILAGLYMLQPNEAAILTLF